MSSTPRIPSPHARGVAALTAVVTALLMGCGDAAVDDGRDWPHYARDLAATKYSPLDQIDADNVGTLEVAWTWESADYRLTGEHEGASVNPNYQATPIKIGDRLYTSTNMGQAAALDPATGQELWRYDPYASGLRDTPAGRANRGVAYWSDGGSERVLLGSGRYLVSLDAETGLPDPAFGNAGAVDLAEDPDPRVLTYSWTSAPLVVRDVVIVGTTAMVPNRNWTTAPPGYVRAYDVRTGALRWRFNPIPEPGDPAIESWADSSWAYSGNGNVWTLMSADDELGHVYLPLKTTTNDWYGGAQARATTSTARVGGGGRRRYRASGSGTTRWSGTACGITTLRPRRTCSTSIVDGRAPQGGGSGHEAGVRLRLRPGDG